ncbi:MAG: STAS domain-containing protein [Desulfobacteraceae bacterium]|uniref:STAS domain-containing protein n=1 Tax=Candidatus Desulfaltia bathyphila TaxID=2841697 RepID=A0A8J6N5F7_9BACT|nr:STAS domain-containing protein [Candidatus Desulfaltia bathyphila]MBL7195116.1 STAS domain-containing protein [Desulfobacterales bacterium]
MPQFTVSQDAEGIFRFKGELTIHGVEYLKRFLDTSFVRAKKISICMADVTFADTASLQLLIAFRRALKPETEWNLLELSPELEKILEISDLKNSLIS